MMAGPLAWQFCVFAAVWTFSILVAMVVTTKMMGTGIGLIATGRPITSFRLGAGLELLFVYAATGLAGAVVATPILKESAPGLNPPLTIAIGMAFTSLIRLLSFDDGDPSDAFELKLWVMAAIAIPLCMAFVDWHAFSSLVPHIAMSQGNDASDKIPSTAFGLTFGPFVFMVLTEGICIAWSGMRPQAS